jgi:hypothetical protein
MANDTQDWSYGNPLVQQDADEYVKNSGNRMFLFIVTAATISATGLAVLLALI